MKKRFFTSTKLQCTVSFSRHLLFHLQIYMCVYNDLCKYLGVIPPNDWLSTAARQIVPIYNVNKNPSHGEVGDPS